jgi:hypothetical protein
MLKFRGDFLSSINVTRRVVIITASIMIVIIILDLLMTRQLLPYNTTSETVMFVLTVIVGYGIGSWILFVYTTKTSSDLRSKSAFINIMHWATWIIQFSLLGAFLFVVASEFYFGVHNHHTRLLTTSIFAISSISASTIMGILGFKFLSWYRLSYRNLMVLLYGIAAITTAIAIAEDAGVKILLINVVEEKSPAGTIPQSNFVYETDEKYRGEIQYKVANRDITTLLVVPTENVVLYDTLNLWPITFSFIFRWAGTSALLYHYFERIGNRLGLTFWTVMSLPLVLYLIGKTPDILDLPPDYPYRFYFRILFRIGTIGGNILFGLAFFFIGRNVITSKSIASQNVKDYLTISAIGIIMLVSFSVSALQQTYGVAAHSLLLLASYLFALGLYSSAISISHDNSLRRSIKKSTVELLGDIGTAQMEQDLKKRIMKMAENRKEKMEEKTGISSSMTLDKIKEYLELVMLEKQTYVPSDKSRQE